MLTMRLLSRANLSQYATTSQRLHTSTLLSNLSDSSSSSSDSDKDAKRKRRVAKPKSEEEISQEQQETSNRLNSLLGTMMTRGSKKPKDSKTLDLSMPARKPKPKPAAPKKTYEESLTSAAEEVATTLGGDVQKTKDDLLKTLQGWYRSTPEKVDASSKVVDAADTPLTLSELLAGMKVDQTPPTSTPSTQQKGNQARFVAQQFNADKSVFDNSVRKTETTMQAGLNRAYLFKGTRLNIFEKSEMASADVPKLETWEHLEKRELKLTQTHPPENIFQEMILWTDQGKLWKFPIDNEQGMEEEQSVHFSEHVFMERHLKDWCPKRGPIRHFMELVCVGLSKNPYMTVKEKTEHLAWYREFFGTKQELLKELGAVEADVPQQPKQVEA